MTDVRVREDYPFRVRRVEHEWVRLTDGTRLAAKLWLPEEAGPVPAVLCYLPYRKNDGTAVGDHQEMAYVAGHGYAGVRVDIRGTGDSDGILLDEYTEQEQLDGLEVIAWIAAQPWCDGNVGMTGASWGGFNSLQLAARRPPALRAILPYFFSDDRYGDDVHYRGGCVLAMDMLPWAATMLSYNAMPPDPRFVGEGWREQWLERLERTPPFIEAWLSHQRRDGYWQQGSVCEDYSAIACPVFAVGGWTDGYTDPVLRVLEGLDVPRRGLIGPWGHGDPVRAVPGPSIGMLQEVVRWWDRWLKGIENGVMDGPMLTVWLQDWTEPAASVAQRPGRWVGEERWPSPRLLPHVLSLGDGTLGEAERATRATGSVQSCGLLSGAWCADGHSPDLPPDQRPEDARSLCFDSAPLPESLELLGFPEATLRLTVDRPLALVCARLCDVGPGGESLLVTRGLLNLAHRDGHERPEPLEPGRTYTVSVRLDSIAHRFRAGHRIRLAISPTYWPWAWPSPEPVTLTVLTGEESTLTLPVRPARPEDDAISFAEPEEPPAYPSTTLQTGAARRTISHDLDTGRSDLRFDWDQGGLWRLDETETEIEYTATALYSIVEGDPLSALVECENGAVCRGPGWDTRNRVLATMTSTASEFQVTTSLEAFEGERRVWARMWTHVFPRDHV